MTSHTLPARLPALDAEPLPRLETIYKNGMRLLDNIDVIRVSNSENRNAVLNVFRKHGVTKPDGRPIEEVVQTSKF